MDWLAQHSTSHIYHKDGDLIWLNHVYNEDGKWSNHVYHEGGNLIWLNHTYHI